MTFGLNQRKTAAMARDYSIGGLRIANYSEVQWEHSPPGF